MFPRLLEIGPITVYTYGLLLAVSYLIGLQVATVRAKARGVDPQKMLDLGIWVIISAIVGAKLLLLAVDFDYFRQRPAEIFSLVRTGGIFYGGLILAVAVAVWYVRRHGMPVWTVGDAVAPGIAFAYAVGRFGCLFGGCCYGAPTSLPWGITFHDHFAAEFVGTPLGVALHPTQLYEAGAALVILAVLLATERRRHPFAGRTFWLYVALYAISRFIIEFFRGDDRGMLYGISTSQAISLVLLPVSLVMLVRLARAGRRAVAVTGTARDHRPARGGGRRPRER